MGYRGFQFLVVFGFLSLLLCRLHPTAVGHAQHYATVRYDVVAVSDRTLSIFTISDALQFHLIYYLCLPKLKALEMN